MTETPNIEFYKNQVQLARAEIKKLRQKLIDLKFEHQKDVKTIKSSLSSLRCSTCNEAATTIAPPQPIPSPTNCIQYNPIGIIETSFLNKRAVPRQPVILNNANGVVVIDTSVFNNPEHALSGLELFSHMWILFHFHATESTSTPAKVSPPRLQGQRCGVFATRSPHRPCTIGMSLVTIKKIEGNRIHFLGVDMVNGTPVLDIKPYIPQYDAPHTGTKIADHAGYGDININSLARPPIEGTSDLTEMIAAVNINDSAESSTVRLTPETPEHSPIHPQDTINIQNIPSPLRHLDNERGSPDGQERFTPPQVIPSHLDGIRVPSWISNPSKYTVKFTEDVIKKLQNLLGHRALEFKANIESLLSEDPRSNYVKTRYPEHEYSCVLEDVSISCVFSSEHCTCTITAVRSAQEMES